MQTQELPKVTDKADQITTLFHLFFFLTAAQVHMTRCPITSGVFGCGFKLLIKQEEGGEKEKKTSPLYMRQIYVLSKKEERGGFLHFFSNSKKKGKHLHYKSMHSNINKEKKRAHVFFLFSSQTSFFPYIEKKK